MERGKIIIVDKYLSFFIYPLSSLKSVLSPPRPSSPCTEGPENNADVYSGTNLPEEPKISHSQQVNLYDNTFTVNINSVLFDGIEKGVFEHTSFDSRPELIFARIIEKDPNVQKWLRPAPQQFNLQYNKVHRYCPDFVVETADCTYLVEIKGEDKIDNDDVLAKRKRAVSYCEVATQWCLANGYKPWKHLFIPSQQVNMSSTFDYIASQFIEPRNTQKRTK